VWPTYHETGTADQADLVKLSSTHLNLMSLYLTLVWQLPIIEHTIGRHGGRSWKRQHPLDQPHYDDDDDDDKSHDLVYHKLVTPVASILAHIHINYST